MPPHATKENLATKGTKAQKSLKKDFCASVPFCGGF